MDYIFNEFSNGFFPLAHLQILFFQDIDYDGFRSFLDAFLDCETPVDLAKHLFVSFLKPNVTQSQLHGKALNQMAAISSTTACAAVTSHTKGECGVCGESKVKTVASVALNCSQYFQFQI